MPMPRMSPRRRSRAPSRRCAPCKGGYSGSYSQAPARTNVRLYADDNPLGAPSFETKVKLLEEIDAYARAQGPARAAGVGLVRRVLAGGRDHARRRRDLSRRAPAGAGQCLGGRGDGDRQESGSHGYGGREGYQRFIETGAWKGAVDEAVRQALVNLEAVPAPAGEMDVVLGAGWPGVMLHEAVGHGLEGDFNRKKTSAFAGLMGQQVAAKGVTVVDDGTIADAARLAHHRRRRHADQPHRADRGRHPGRLHAGPAERAADGHEADRQRPAREPTPTCRCRA